MVSPAAGELKIVLVSLGELSDEDEFTKALVAELERRKVVVVETSMADAEADIDEHQPHLVVLCGTRGAGLLSTLLDDGLQGTRPRLVVTASRTELGKVQGLNRNVVAGLLATELGERLVVERLQTLARQAIQLRQGARRHKLPETRKVEAPPVEGERSSSNPSTPEFFAGVESSILDSLFAPAPEGAPAAAPSASPTSDKEGTTPVMPFGREEFQPAPEPPDAGKAEGRREKEEVPAVEAAPAVVAAEAPSAVEAVPAETPASPAVEVPSAPVPAVEASPADEVVQADANVEVLEDLSAAAESIAPAANVEDLSATMESIPPSVPAPAEARAEAPKLRSTEAVAPPKAPIRRSPEQKPERPVRKGRGVWVLALLVGGALAVYFSSSGGRTVPSEASLDRTQLSRALPPESSEPAKSPEASESKEAASSQAASLENGVEQAPDSVLPEIGSGDPLKIEEATVLGCDALLSDFEPRLVDPVQEASQAWKVARDAIVKGDVRTAEKKMCEAVARHPQSAALEGLVQLYVNQGAPRRALSYLERAEAVRPAESETLNLRGDVLSQLGEGEQALDAWLRALRLPAEDKARRRATALGLTTQGKAQARRGALPQAERLLRRAAALDPENVAALSALSEVFLKTDRLAEAVALARRALAIHELTPEAHVVLGDVALRADSPSEARQSYERALKMRSDHWPAKQRLRELAEKEAKASQ